MPAARSLITLLTDFGDRDYFVASMKGVIVSINPNARLIDLSHHVAPYQVREAAYLLKSCYRYFPAGTIHVAVVDPGVGSARRPVVVSAGRSFFVAPDNGLLTPIMEENNPVEIRQIENAQYRLQGEGETFHGRDIFAPAAAWLSKRQPLASFGRLVQDPVRLDAPKPVWENGILVGSIVHVDRFGNLISNITATQYKDALRARSSARIRIAGLEIEGAVSSYAEGRTGAPAALINSNGFLEVFVKESSAAASLNVGVGAAVHVG